MSSRSPRFSSKPRSLSLGPTLKGVHVISFARNARPFHARFTDRPQERNDRSLLFFSFLFFFFPFFLFRRPRFRRTMKSPKTKSEIRRARTPRDSSRYVESLPWKRRVCSAFAYTRCPGRTTPLFPSLFPRKTSFARQLALKL